MKNDTLTHLDREGRARMVDVGGKDASVREAVARAVVRMEPATMARLRQGDTPKGDVLAVARVAAIQAAKKTPDLIPLCHPIRLNAVDVALEPRGDEPVLDIEVKVRAGDRTGVEMEALTAASVAALTVYDMLKAVDKGMVIEQVALWHKSGGKSGDYNR